MIYVPYLLQKTAEGIAGAFYDEQMVLGAEQPRERSTTFRGNFPSERAYIAANWPYFLRAARATLSDMLRLPGTPEDQRLVIYDALVEDRQRNS